MKSYTTRARHSAQPVTFALEDANLRMVILLSCCLRKCFAVGSLALLGSVLTAAPPPAPAAPVLLELFTSEGCSSCPPADHLLATLDREQPVPGVELIVLSEHVDYWDHLGWRDPYSSHAASQRQEEYASRMGGIDIYTPQLVIDGSTQVLGSSWPAVRAAIAKSLQTPKIPVSLSAREQGGQYAVHLAANPSQASGARGDVYLVIAAEHVRDQVFRGENAGHSIDHVAVSGPIRKVGKLTPGAAFTKDLTLAPDEKLPPGPVRLIAFVQDSHSRHILGVAAARLPANQSAKMDAPR